MCFPGGGGGSDAVEIPPINIPTPTGSAGAATGALPTSAQIGASGPQPYSAFGDVPQVTAAQLAAPQVGAAPTTGTPQVDPNTPFSQGLTQGENANAQALQPLFQQQEMGLSDNLASRGITNSGAAGYLSNNLAGTEASELAAADAPLITQAAGLSGQDTLANLQAGLTTGGENLNSQLNTNSGNLQSALETGLTNTGAENNASDFNAQSYGNTVASDESNYNNWQNELFQTGNQFGQELLQGYIGSYGGANPQTLSSIGGEAGNIGAAGAGATAPNFGSAFGSAFNNIPNLNFGGTGGGVQSTGEISNVFNNAATTSGIAAPVEGAEAADAAALFV